MLISGLCLTSSSHFSAEAPIRAARWLLAQHCRTDQRQKCLFIRVKRFCDRTSSEAEFGTKPTCRRGRCTSAVRGWTGFAHPTRRAQRQSCSSRSLSTQVDERRLESISVVHVAGPYPMTVECHRGRRYFFQLADGSSPPKTGIKI